eukprot:350895-Chlamydomonas_euryale.AAC.5
MALIASGPYHCHTSAAIMKYLASLERIQRTNVHVRMDTPMDRWTYRWTDGQTDWRMPGGLTWHELLAG